MRANFGEHFKLTIFGESHGPAIGVVLDGLPAGAQIDETYIARQMARRAPGNDPTATTRKEADAVRVLSGVLGGRRRRAALRDDRKHEHAIRRLSKHCVEHASRPMRITRAMSNIAA